MCVWSHMCEQRRQRFEQRASLFVSATHVCEQRGQRPHRCVSTHTHTKRTPGPALIWVGKKKGTGGVRESKREANINIAV